MTGLSGAPSHGVRLEVVLDEEASTKDRAVYRGKLHEPEASRDVEAVATKDGVELRLEPDDEALRKAAAALVHAATRAELTAGDAAPRKIVRWRDKG